MPVPKNISQIQALPSGASTPISSRDRMRLALRLGKALLARWRLVSEECRRTAIAEPSQAPDGAFTYTVDGGKPMTASPRASATHAAILILTAAILLTSPPAEAANPAGSLAAWGSNADGQLGDNSSVDRTLPVPVSGLTGVLAIAAGGHHTLALRNDGTVWAFGLNDDGQLGNAATTISRVPIQVPGLSRITAVAAGGSHSLALKDDGTVMAWGDDSYGQLGIRGGTSSIPLPIGRLTGIVAVAAGWAHSLALKKDGTVWAWGLNADGQLGNNDTTSSAVPVRVGSLTGIVAVAGGGRHSLALKNDGTVWTWGDNEFGELGVNSSASTSIPVQVAGLTKFAAIAGGGEHSLAVMRDGTVWAWGSNFSGQLGSDAAASSRVPIKVSGLSGVTSIAAGRDHSLALKGDGTAWAWGDNSFGQLGSRLAGSRVPVRLDGLSQVSAIAAGGDQSFAILSSPGPAPSPNQAVPVPPVSPAPPVPVPAAVTPKPALKDEMRTLWEPPHGSYIRHCLLCGEFPNPGNANRKTDFLTEHGGETGIQPVAGMQHLRPDGSIAAWTEVTSPDDVVDFVKAFSPRPTNDVVCYAFTTIDSNADERALLSLGSDDGVQAWVNGVLVLDHPGARGLTRDQDQVEIALKPGANGLLVKVDQGGGAWALCVRILSHAAALVLPPQAPSVTMVPTDAAHPHRLTVQLGRTTPGSGAPEAVATVMVVGAGGRVWAEKHGRAGEVVLFSTAGWPDGACDIRCDALLPGGHKTVAYASWYHGDARAAARRLVSAAAKANPQTRVGMVHAMLADMVLDRLGNDIENAKPESLPSIDSPLMEWEELRMANGAGGIRPGGVFRLAYRDPVDDSPQFCLAFLPTGYTPRRRWPMIVNLHGYNSSNPVYVKWGIDGRHNGWADTYGVIVIEPMGRYNTTFRGIGEADVLRCIDLAKTVLSVDDNRVYLTGASMGGGGAWLVGTRHPDLFAAIAPVFGGRDYHADLTDQQAAALGPHDRYRLEIHSTLAQAESLLTTPVFINHGDQDDLVNVETSRYAVRTMQRWGYDVRYWEHPGVGHGGLGETDAMLRWLLSHKRTAAPTHVRLRAADVADASSHWVRVEQFLHPWQVANVDARVTGPNIIQLDTQNVARITLSPTARIIDPQQPIQVVWNSSDLRVVDLANGSVTLDAAGYIAPPGGKTPAISGRLENVFATPFAIVVGTTSTDPSMQRFIRRAGDDLAGWWQQSQHAMPRVYRDTELPNAVRDRCSLVLLGGPDDNVVTRQLADRLPLLVSHNGFTIDSRFFPAVDAVADVVYPHATNPDRYVAVIAANSSRGMFFWDQLPQDVDFAVVDGHATDDPDGPPNDRLRIVEGMFNNAWHIDPAFLSTGDSTLRARAPLRKVPASLDAKAPGNRLRIADLLETASEGTFRDMRRDLNWQGKTLTLGGVAYDHGIAVQVSHDPCSVTYDLNGAGWKRFKAMIGIEINAATMDQQARDNTQVEFRVEGDGKELYKSPMVHWDTAPIPIDLDISGVNTLKLFIKEGTTWHNAARSVDWADARLEK